MIEKTRIRELHLWDLFHERGKFTIVDVRTDQVIFETYGLTVAVALTRELFDREIDRNNRELLKRTDNEK